MVSAVNTGVPLQGGTVNSPGQEQQAANTFFDVNSTEGTSHRFSVHESPYYIKAFNLGESAFVELLMVTDTPNGEVVEQMRLNGNAVNLTEMGNCLVIDIPGDYRLSLSGNIGVATVVGGMTALSYWSWGLKAFASAS